MNLLPRLIFERLVVFLRASLLATLAVVAAANPLRAEDMPVLAVLPFKAAASIPKPVVELLEAEVTRGFIRSGAFRLVERTNLEAILKEQAFQKSGCASASCAVEIGKLLAAGYVLTGFVSRAGAAYLLSVQVVDVEQGVTKLSDFQEFKDLAAMESAARSLTLRLIRRTKGADFEPPDVQNRRRAALWRSAVLPGWGQYAGDSRLKGGVLMSASVFFVGKYYHHAQKLASERARLRAFENQLWFVRDTGGLLIYAIHGSDLKARAHTQTTLRNGAADWYLGLMLFGMLDILFFSAEDFTSALGTRSLAGESPRVSVHLGLTRATDSDAGVRTLPQVNMRVTLRW